MEQKPTLYTAFKPTGRLTIGNYIGAVNNFKKYVNDYSSIICVADLHALTMNLPKEELLNNTYHIFAFYLALGINPEETLFYVQSQVKQHAELAWVLNNFIGFGEASRMTQFKDHLAKNKAVNVGLFSYPVLMAADILLYNASIVPVGVDQKQHVELTRNIAQKFNSRYGETFILPEPIIEAVGAKIGGLQEPSKKMSKSDEGDNGVIYIEDSPEQVINKVKRAVTDSDNNISYDPENKPGVSNLLVIYSKLKNISINEAVSHFEGKNYGALKLEVANTINQTLAPIKEKYNYYINNKPLLNELMAKGAKRVEALAEKTLKEVYEKLGLVPRI